MKTLNFDYDYPVSTAEYKGYKVEAIHDDSAENPFEAWDCEPPVMVRGDRWGETWGDDAPGIDDALTRQQLIDNLPAVLGAVGYKTLLGFARENQYGVGYAGAIVDTLNDAITDYADESFENRAEVLKWQGIVSLHTTITGCVQSAWWECLIIATPEWREKTGAKIENENDLKGTRDLLEAYLTGEVYGYSIEGPDGEDVDSCYGYYGEPNTSGLSEAAIDAIEYDTIARRRVKQSTLKDLIRNHVPLIYRERELQS